MAHSKFIKCDLTEWIKEEVKDSPMRKDMEEGKIIERESSILAKIRQTFNRGCVRLFRNNQGAYEKSGYYIKYGLCNPGGSDLLGWQTIIITPELIGSSVAVFLAVEVKTPGKKATPEQINFIAAVKKAGGFAGVASSAVEVSGILDIKNLYSKPVDTIK